MRWYCKRTGNVIEKNTRIIHSKLTSIWLSNENVELLHNFNGLTIAISRPLIAYYVIWVLPTVGYRTVTSSCQLLCHLVFGSDSSHSQSYRIFYEINYNRYSFQVASIFAKVFIIRITSLTRLIKWCFESEKWEFLSWIGTTYLQQDV